MQMRNDVSNFFTAYVLFPSHSLDFSYADIMLAEAMQMLLVRVGPSPFQPFPRLLALHSHITGMPAIAR